MIRLVLLCALVAVVLSRSSVTPVNGQSVAFPFAFRFMPFKFPKRGDGQLLDWPSWTMLKAGPYALRPLSRVTGAAERPGVAGRDEYNYGPEPLDENGKATASSSTRTLGKYGLCHFKICPVGKRSPTNGKVKHAEDERGNAVTTSTVRDAGSSLEVDYNYSDQK